MSGFRCPEPGVKRGCTHNLAPILPQRVYNNVPADYMERNSNAVLSERAPITLDNLGKKNCYATMHCGAKKTLRKIAKKVR